MIPRRAALSGLLGCTLCGCAGAVHRLPEAATADLAAAQAEIAAAGPTPRRDLPDREVLATLRRVRDRLLPPAQALCHDIQAGTCRWQIRASRSREVNAYAAGSGVVVIQKGILQLARSDDEVALVVGHEIAHHAANHVVQRRRNAAIGHALGGFIPSLAVRAIDLFRPPGVRPRDGDGVELGEELGRLSFSREQEREADYLAAVMLHRAGYSLAAARGLQLSLAREVKDRDPDELEAWIFDSHPSGPERLAAYDRAVAEITASNGALPPRA